VKENMLGQRKRRPSGEGGNGGKDRGGVPGRGGVKALYTGRGRVSGTENGSI